MEKIFKEYRQPVEDNGFSESVMSNVINSLGTPSKNIYRMPTLIATMTTVVAIVILTLTVGLDNISDKYLEVASNIRHVDKVEKVVDSGVDDSTTEVDDFVE